MYLLPEWGAGLVELPARVFPFSILDVWSGSRSDLSSSIFSILKSLTHSKSRCHGTRLQHTGAAPFLSSRAICTCLPPIVAAPLPFPGVISFLIVSRSRFSRRRPFRCPVFLRILPLVYYSRRFFCRFSVLFDCPFSTSFFVFLLQGGREEAGGGHVHVCPSLRHRHLLHNRGVSCFLPWITLMCNTPYLFGMAENDG